MVQDDLFKLSLAGLAFGAFGFFAGFSAWRTKNLIQNTPTSKIRSLAMGLVEINGKALAEKYFTSPITRKICVYCRTDVYEYRRSGKSSRWVLIKTAVDQQRFSVEDDTGKVLVDPAGAGFEISPQREVKLQGLKTIPPSLSGFCSNQQIAMNALFGRRNLKFVETLIEKNAQVYVLGTAQDNPLVAEGTAQRQHEDIMIAKANNIYLISDKAEKDLVSKYKWIIVLGLWGGGALIVASLAGLFWNFGIL